MSKWRENLTAWRQLLRAANVFTAVSNVLAGYLLGAGAWQPTIPLAALVLASASLYLAGMVLNDVFDAEVDAQERPERPLPSERINRLLAKLVGWGMLATGVAFSGVASALIESVAPLVIGGALAIAIVMYDSGLKRVWAGPLAMGWCRMLNVLLGASIAGDSLPQSAWLVASAVGLYTVGLTLLARHEADDPRRTQMKLAGLLLVGSIGLLLALPWTTELAVPSMYWYLAWSVVLELAALAFMAAYRRPESRSVQLSVKRIILLFLGIDALVCLAAGGWLAAGVVLSLLIPTLVLARRTAMT